MSENHVGRLPEPPRWTSSQSGKNYMLGVEELNPVNEPQSMGQRVVATVRDDKRPRRVVDVAVPHLPYEVWIDEAGNLMNVPMKTTRVSKVVRGRRGERMSSIDNGNHYTQQEREKYGAGWLKYDSGAQGEGREAWLARRDDVIAERSAQQAEEMSEVEQKLTEKDRADMKKDFRDFLKSIANEGSKDRAKRKKVREAMAAPPEGDADDDTTSNDED